MLDWSEYVKIFIAILVIVNPLGAVPFYISLTTGLKPADDDSKAKAARTAMLASRTNLVLSVPMLYCMVTQFYLRA